MSDVQEWPGEFAGTNRQLDELKRVDPPSDWRLEEFPGYLPRDDNKPLSRMQWLAGSEWRTEQIRGVKYRITQGVQKDSPAGTQVCFECGLPKSLSEFSVTMSKTGKPQRATQCKACISAKKYMRYKNRPFVKKTPCRKPCGR